MAHKYYCTNCARELNQDLALLDMETALTVTSDERFSVLKFRLTLQEFNALTQSGQKGDLGYLSIDLPFDKFAGYLGNENNLNDADIAALTMKDVQDFLADRRSSEFDFGDQTEDDAMSVLNQLGGFDTDDLFGDKKEEDAEEDAEAYVPSPAIEALRHKITVAQGTTLTDQSLENDLNRLVRLFDDNGVAHLEINPTYEEADTGDQILIGYTTRRGKKEIPVKARVCRYCGAPVFDHAGAAVHQSVAFIGEPSSAKTSTILALTHYAQEAARSIKPGEKIWSNSFSIGEIDYIDVVSQEADLMEDLGLYDIGVAPKKTNAREREDAYSSTLWISNKAGKKFILTLIDLPGELCKDDGSIEGEKIMTNFPVALACDVFVVCFDTTRAKGGAANSTIRKTCSWASEFQTLRQDYKKRATIKTQDTDETAVHRNQIAPMMVLFTKCEELESGVVEKEKEKAAFNPKRVDEVYSLKVEREFIDRNLIYKDVGELIQVYENLKYAYIARLRTSPYGFAAPNKPMYMEDHSVNKNPDGTIRVPEPKQVAELMRWLLTITGCIPADAVFCPNPLEPEHIYKLRDTYVTRPQYRVMEANGRTRTDKINEAMCRAFLFENYTAKDKELIESYDKEQGPAIPLIGTPSLPEWLKRRLNGGRG